MLSVCLVAIMVLIIISIIIYNKYFSQYRTDTIKSAENSVENIESLISQRLFEMKTLAFTVERNPAFSFYPYESESDLGTDLNIVYQLQNYAGANIFYAALGFSRSSEPSIIYTSQGEFSLDEMNNYVFEIEESPFENKQFFNINIGKSKLVITNDETVYQFSDSLDYGKDIPDKIIYFYVYKNNIDELINTSFGNDLEQLIILNESGMPVYSKSQYDGELLEEINTSFQNKEINSDDTIVKTNVDELSCFLKRSAHNNWSYIAVFNRQKLFSHYNNALLQFGIMAIIILIMIFAVSVLFALYSHRPLHQLTSKFRHNFGNMESKSKLYDDNEYIDKVVDVILDSRLERQQQSVL